MPKIFDLYREKKILLTVQHVQYVCIIKNAKKSLASVRMKCSIESGTPK